MVDIAAITDIITNQYPHYLYRRASAESVQNANGSWVETSSPAYVSCGSCREETSGRGGRVQTANGVYRDFSAIVQMPTAVERIPEGTEVVVTNVKVAADKLLSTDFVEQAKEEGIVRIAGECLKFDEGRLHNRLWV